MKSIFRQFQERIKEGLEKQTEPDNESVLSTQPVEEKRNALKKNAAVSDKKGKKKVHQEETKVSKLVRKKRDSVLVASISEDLNALKGLKSKDDKAAFKAKLIEKYKSEVNKHIKSKSGKSEILGYYLVWLFDAGLIPEALKFSEFCLKHNVSTPEIIKRNTETFIYDSFLEWATAQYRKGLGANPYFEDKLKTVAKANIPDEVKASYFRLAGLFADRYEEPEKAFIAYQAALEYGAKVSCKLNAAKKKLKRAS